MTSIAGEHLDSLMHCYAQFTLGILVISPCAVTSLQIAFANSCVCYQRSHLPNSHQTEPRLPADGCVPLPQGRLCGREDSD